MSLLTSSVGRKVLMAVSGFFLLGFIVAHLIGNSTIFVGAGWINAYAEHLHDLGPFVWVFRSFMLLMLCVHILMGVILTLVLDTLLRQPRRWHYPAGFYLAGVGFVLAG